MDFVVVGSGAAGGVMARELSRAGFTVLVFEQGPRLGPADFEHDELKYFLHERHHQSARMLSPQTFRKLPTETAQQPMGGFLPATYARLVGGSSVHYTANFWRFHEIDFKERSVLGSIPGTAFDDWPISYAELEPYYTKVEWEVGVLGLGVCQSLRSAALETLSHAAATREILRRAVRTRCPQTGPASLSRTHGDCLAALPRPLGVHQLRLLHGLWLRSAGQVFLAVHLDPGSRGHGPVRNPPVELCVSGRNQRQGPHHRRSLFRRG